MAENEYVKLIEKMREMKKEETQRLEREASMDELDQAMSDFMKEQEDLKMAEGTGLKLKRPPKTVKETIETLKEADVRYESAKPFLFGSNTPSEPKKSKVIETDIDPLRNVPRGMSL